MVLTLRQTSIPDRLYVQPIAADLWVEVDSIPDYLDTEFLADLYRFLRMHVTADAASPFADFQDTAKVLRFVDPNKYYPFPRSCEGYAGMCDAAYWSCVPARRGNFNCANSLEPRPDYTPILLAVVALLSADPPQSRDLGIFIGNITHELAHMLGAVDRDFEQLGCSAEAIDAPYDAYWWFGPCQEDMFTWQPKGVVWNAFHDTCVHELCIQLRQEVLIPHGYYAQ
jgi:hypothetical protein